VRDVDGVRDRPNDHRGFIHKKILGVGAKILGVAGTVIPLPGAGILRTAGDILGGFAQPSRPRAPSPIQFPFSGGRGGGERVPPDIRAVAEAKQRMIEGNRVRGGRPSTNGCPPEAQVCAPRGFHLNKSSYFLRDGTFIERGSIFVRNRRLNNANGRAQDKAIVRLEKGQDHAKKLLKATGWRTISKQSSREMRNARKAVCK